MQIASKGLKCGDIANTVLGKDDLLNNGSIVTLIYPPATDPRSPHLPLPALAAFLRGVGIRTTQLDLDIKSLIAMLRPDNIVVAGQRIRDKANTATGEQRDKLHRLIAVSESLPSVIDQAFATLRHSELFYDANHRNTAKERILDGLDLVSSAAERRVSYSIDVMHYEVEGVDETRLAHLIEVAKDPKANLFVEYWNVEILPAINAQRPVLVGISLTTRQQLLPGLMLAYKLKAAGHFVVLGGTLFTRFVDRLASLPEFFEYFADGVVSYEGETAMVELVDQLQGKRDFHKVPNFLFCEGKQVHHTRFHLEDVTNLPTPDFDGLPLDIYLTPTPVLPFLIGKGCYWDRCKFCASGHINRLSKKRYRIRPIHKVIEDILELASRHDCRHFMIADEAVPPKIFDQLADELIVSGRSNLRFTAYTRFETGFTSKLLEKIESVGVRRLLFGLESASQKTLDHMDKGIDMKNVLPVINRCNKAGIRFHVFSMLGFPEETDENANKTLKFFEDNDAIFSKPGNSYDIHPFELHLHSPYGFEKEELGLQIDPGLLSREFTVGIGTQWDNTRGLSRVEFDQKFQEFFEQMGEIRLEEGTSGHLWPISEEWSLLYADIYNNRLFPFSLSPFVNGTPMTCRLRWNPSAIVKRNKESVWISSRRATINIEESVYKTFVDTGFRSLSELPKALGKDKTSAISTLYAMINASLLQHETRQEFL